MKKFWTIFIVVILLAAAAGGYFYWRARTKAAQGTQWQTAPVQRGTLSATIGATGSVRARQTATLTWQASGTVEFVKVKPGDTVKAGDELASLLKTSLSQNIILAEADLITAQRNLDNLLKSNTPSAQALVNLTSARKALEDAQKNYDTVTGKGITQADINNAEADYILAQQRVEDAQKLYDTLAGLPDSDPRRAQAYNNLYAATLARDRALATLNWMRGTRSELQIAQAEAQLELTKARVEDAEREWERLKDGPDAADLLAAQARVTAIQATLNTVHISAPFAGTVTEVFPLPGDQVTPGKPAFRVDDLSSLLVDVQVSEVDINSVKLGQMVTLTFDAVLGQEYHGKVVEIAQAGDNINGSVYFTITVELDDADAQVRPGMTAAVTIEVNRLDNVLLVPRRAIRLVDGEYVVYIMKNGQPAKVVITLGVSSDTDSEVTSGDLNEGDELILNPSTILVSGNNSAPGFMRP
jgi:HlyD family secretion protein